MRTSLALRLAALAAASALAACTATVGGSQDSAAQGVSVVVTPDAIELAPGQETQFGAMVTGTADGEVTWSIDEAGGGTIDQAGNYTAPAADGVYHIRAASHASPQASAVATATVRTPAAGSVAISPHTTTVVAGGSATFTATVTNATNTAVTWSVQEASGCGSVSAAGVYTAPAASAICHVVATSVADATRSDVATVTVTAPPVAVAVTPVAATVVAGGSATFTATVTNATNTAVTWSVQEASGCGSVSAAGVYTAPSVAATCHVVSRSVADTTKAAVATVTVTPLPVAVTIAPAIATVAAGGTLTFTATVTNATNTAVTWSVQEASGCGSVSAAGVYTAPSVAATCHVVSRSVADTTKAAVATVTVTPLPVAVTIAPAIATVAAGGTLTFTATVTNATNTAVTWSVQEASGCGSVSAAGVYTAPSVAATCHVVSRSVADTTKAAVATVTVTPPPVGAA